MILPQLLSFFNIYIVLLLIFFVFRSKVFVFFCIYLSERVTYLPKRVTVSLISLIKWVKNDRKNESNFSWRKGFRSQFVTKALQMVSVNAFLKILMIQTKYFSLTRRRYYFSIDVLYIFKFLYISIWRKE